MAGKTRERLHRLKRRLSRKEPEPLSVVKLARMIDGMRRENGDRRAIERGEVFEPSPRWGFLARFERAALAKASTQDPPGTPSGTTEIGSTGLRQHSGFVDEEFLRQLKGKQGLQTYREMSSNDATIGAMLFAIQMAIRQVKWRVEAAGEEKLDIDKATFLAECKDDMSETFVDLIAEILSFIPMGFSLHEPVFKKRGGPSRDPKQNSMHNDGRIGWQKIPGRSQETIDRWLFDDTGELEGCEQVALPTLNRVPIPASRFLLFRTTTSKGNPEGVSCLRTAYKPWFFKRRIEEIEGIGIERDLAGLPIAWAPAEFFGSDAKPENKATLEELRKAVINVKRDDQEGLLMPLEYDDNGNKRYDFTLLSSGGRRQFDTTSIIDRYDKRIAMTVLADFLLLGQSAVGSFALSDNKTELFASALGAWLDVIEQIFNRQAIPQLFSMNTFGETTSLPELKHGDIETVDLEKFADFMVKLTAAGVLTGDDDDIKDHVRQVYNLPARREDTGGTTGGGTDTDPDTGDGGPSAEGVDESAAVTGSEVLNGSQITSALDIVARVVENRLTLESAVVAFRVLLGIEEGAARAIIGDPSQLQSAEAVAKVRAADPEEVAALLKKTAILGKTLERIH